MAGKDTRHYDAIVIGSGFGGAVAGYHLANAGLTVLLLERGMPYPPRSFARTPRQMRRAFWDPASGVHGLFEMWSFSKVRALVASGLGGGSLIYANVLLRKPPDTFGPGAPDDFTQWPVQPADLDAEYADVERRLSPNPLPDDYFTASPDQGGVAKTQQFFAAAQAAGLKPERAPIAVSFRPSADAPAEPGVPFGSDNLHARTRHTCTLAGECDLGCNEGAKNSLDYTYLSDFAKLGGQIFTCCEAQDIEPADQGRYRVRYFEHAGAREMVLRRRRPNDAAPLLLDDAPDSPDPTRTVTADVVVVAAGTFGSTRLLLRSRPRMPRLSACLGRRFSTNGDLLTFARECRNPDGSWRDLDPSLGPVITAYARDTDDGRQLWMQDAGGPALSEWAWQAGETLRDLWSARALGPSLLCGRRGGRVSGLMAQALGSAEASSAMLPMLTMGQDTSGGRLRLEGNGLALDWDPHGRSSSYFDAAMRLAERFAHHLGGRLGPPLWRRWAAGLTAHPLGGCPMGVDARSGVVDSSGEVFGYPGLFVADGSIMPGPVGPNPSLTIAAMAGRIGKAARDYTLARRPA